MKKATAKGFCGVSLNRMAVVAIIMLVRTCVLSCIISAVYTKADGRVTLLSATTTEPDAVSQPPPYSRMGNTTHVSVWNLSAQSAKSASKKLLFSIACILIAH